MELIGCFILVANQIAMAEITSGDSHRQHNKAGVSRMKKQSLRIDLTPMVDLGFLLITFFIITTSMTEPKSSELTLPDSKNNVPMPVPESGSLTLLPVGNSIVYYYNGQLQSNHSNLFKTTEQAIRKVIQQKKTFVGNSKLFVILKPANTCVFQDVVTMLDEMLINDVSHYAMADMDEEERRLLKQ